MFDLVFHFALLHSLTHPPTYPIHVCLGPELHQALAVLLPLLHTLCDVFDGVTLKRVAGSGEGTDAGMGPYVLYRATYAILSCWVPLVDILV